MQLTQTVYIIIIYTIKINKSCLYIYSDFYICKIDIRETVDPVNLAFILSLTSNPNISIQLYVLFFL